MDGYPYLFIFSSNTTLTGHIAGVFDSEFCCNTPWADRQDFFKVPDIARASCNSNKCRRCRAIRIPRPGVRHLDPSILDILIKHRFQCL